MIVEQTDDKTLLAPATGFKVTGVLGHAGPCYLTGFILANASNAARFIKLYDQATIPDENDTPAIRLNIPGNSTTGGQVISFRCKVLFQTGLAIRGTTGGADNNTGAPDSYDLMGIVTYAPTKLA